MGDMADMYSDYYGDDCNGEERDWHDDVDERWVELSRLSSQRLCIMARPSRSKRIKGIRDYYIHLRKLSRKQRNCLIYWIVKYADTE